MDLIKAVNKSADEYQRITKKKKQKDRISLMIILGAYFFVCVFGTIDFICLIIDCFV